MSYNPNIPGPNDLLSQSQGQIQTNFSQISTWTAVDHIGITTASNTGEHAQVTLPAPGTAGSPSGLESTLYSAPGTADNTKTQLFFKNALAVFPISPIKAFGTFSVSGSTITLSNGSNMGSPSYSSAGRYVINLSITLPSSSYAVIATPWTPSNGGFPNVSISYVIQSASQFTLYVQNTSSSVALDAPNFSVMVLQV